MKTIRGNRAFTLIEVLLSIAIFAAIALPLFSVFVQSIKTDRKAYDVLNANYISQGYIEKLDAVKYTDALTQRPQGVEVDGYYLTATIEPYGAVGSLFDDECGYLHLIMNDDNSMLAVMPDGKWHKFTTVPSSISLNITTGHYSFTGGVTSISGELDFGYCAVLINAMRKPANIKTSISLGTNCRAVQYCPVLHEEDITFSGSSETYVNIMDETKSLIHVFASVLDSSSTQVAVSEAFISVNNW